MSKAVLVITGDGGESYETLYAVHRLREAGYEPRIAAPSRKRLNLVMHDFEPGWDTYIERPGYQVESDLAFDEVKVDDYDAVLVLGGRAPEYLRHDTRVLDIVRGFHAAREVGVRDLSRRAGAGERRAGEGARATAYEHVAPTSSVAAGSTSPTRRRCGTGGWSRGRRGSRIPSSIAK